MVRKDIFKAKKNKTNDQRILFVCYTIEISETKFI